MCIALADPCCIHGANEPEGPIMGLPGMLFMAEFPDTYEADSPNFRVEYPDDFSPRW